MFTASGEVQTLAVHRLLVIGNGYPPEDLGGAQEAVYRSTEVLRRSGWSVQVLLLQPPGRYAAERINAGVHRVLLRVPRPGRGILSFLGNWIRFAIHLPGSLHRALHLAKVAAPELIVVHIPLEAGYYALFLARVLRLPLVTHLHGWEIDGFDSFGPLRRWVVRRALRSSVSVLTNSRQLLNKAVRLDPSLSARSFVAGNGVSIEELRRDSQSGAPLVEGTYLFALGRFVERKGFDILVRALALLRSHLGQSAPSLVLAGDGPAGPRLLEIARECGVEEGIKFWGVASRRDVSLLLRYCLACVVPSRQEAFGIVLLEAMAIGAPIVASRCGGIPEIVEDGRTGMLVTPEDPGALAGAIERLIDSPALRAQLSREGRREAEGRWSWDRVALDFAHGYESALHGGAIDSMPQAKPR